VAEFTRRPLQILDGIYRFVGGLRGVNTVDLSSDITLVHDVSRLAERNGYGDNQGYLRWDGSIDVNGGPLEAILIRDTDVRPVLKYDNELYELWIMRASAYQAMSLPSADLLTLFVGRDANSEPGGCPEGAIVLGTGGDESAPVCSWALADQVYTSDSSGNTRGAYSTDPTLFKPVRVPIGGFVGWSWKTIGATEVFFTTWMWAGPLGSTPPGLP
jgi:hypothetical protein